MDAQPLGKGEVESSILSCSTIIPNEIKGTCEAGTLDAQARLRRGESGTAARIWQTLGDYYGDQADFPDTSVETTPGTPGEHSWKVET